ncbi:MAG: isoaspartyl peptidase/L-asparaginase [Parvularculaceae bacterium]|nr:isoaspartyl peptidase/L-asparaginase [Parvularculaceae bacterium]
MSKPANIALALHGGAGAKPGRDYSVAEKFLADLCIRGEELLKIGTPSIDVVEAMVVAMEDSGYFVAGRGSAPNRAGYVELDASIMQGGLAGENAPAGRRAGAVAAVAHLKNPIRAARAVMENTPHVMLVGRGAENFCRSQGCEFVVDPATYYITAIGVTSEETIQNELSHGTVGAVALDMNGRLASATSTGGVFGKLEGRVGDTPLIGAGTWADEYVAASCTGLGEFFILAGGAQDIASRVRYQGADLNQAAQGLIRDVGRQGGNGGVICLSRDGDIGFAWNSGGMKRAGVGPNNPLFAATF